MAKLISAAISAKGVASNVHEGPLTVTHPEPGRYTIEFGEGLGSPVIVCTYQGAGNNGLGIIPYNISSSGFSVEVRNTQNLNADSPWEFVATGSAIWEGSGRLAGKTLLSVLGKSAIKGAAKLLSAAKLIVTARKVKIGTGRLPTIAKLSAFAVKIKLIRGRGMLRTLARLAGAGEELRSSSEQTFLLEGEMDYERRSTWP